MFKPRYNTPKVKVIPSLTPKIIVTLEALLKMKYIVELSKDEVGWFGTVHHIQENMFLIDNVYLFEQEVHSTTCEITPEGLAKFAQEYIDNDDIATLNRMQLWGHSHVSMTVGASGQDDKQMEVFKDSGHDWFIRAIANKKGEMEFTLYDFKSGIIYEDVPWDAYMPNEEQIAKHIAEELKNKVKEKVETSVYRYGNGYGYNYGYGDYEDFPSCSCQTSKKEEEKEEKEEKGKVVHLHIDSNTLIRDDLDVYSLLYIEDLLQIGEFIDINYIDLERSNDLELFQYHLATYASLPTDDLSEREIAIIYDVAWEEYIEHYSNIDNNTTVDDLIADIEEKKNSGNYLN